MKIKTTKKSLLIISIGALLIILVIGLIKQISHKSQAKNKFISPLAEAKNINQEAKSTPIYNMQYYLHLSKSFLYKATRLANDNPSQTDADKMNVLNNINKSLQAANQAIKYYPNQPEPYLARSQIYQKVANFFPEGKDRAQQDIKTANKLINKTSKANIPLEKDARPLNFIPTQKANLDKKITIAEPRENSELKTQNSELNINAFSGTAVLKAGKKQVIIKTSQVKAKNQVYIVPQGKADNKVLSVISKKENKWFKVGMDSTSNKDIIFNWWIIN